MKSAFVILKYLVLISLLAVTLFYLQKTGNLDKITNYLEDAKLNLFAIKVSADNSGRGSIKEDSKFLSVNVSICTADLKKVDSTYGSTTVVVVDSNSDHQCFLKIKGGKDKPQESGGLSKRCKVPIELKTVWFEKNDYGFDISSINQYCKG